MRITDKPEKPQFRIIRRDTDEYYVPWTGGRTHHIVKGWEKVYCSWTHDSNDFWLTIAGTWDNRKDAQWALDTADDIHDVDRAKLLVTQLVPFPE